MKNLLECVGGCPLDIVSYRSAVDVMLLLLPYTKQIRSLDFNFNTWPEIRTFSELNSGPLPLLRMLRINEIEGIDLDNPDAMIPSIPFFSTAVNMQEFQLHSWNWLPLNHFVFPNLTFFELSAIRGELQAAQLLGFLEASLMLQTVHMDMYGVISFDGVPRERVAVLHNVKSFCLVMGDGEPCCKLATHISCPSVKHTSLTRQHEDLDSSTPQEIFPASVSWNTIIRQYTSSPLEEVALEMEASPNLTITCSLTFRSPDASVIQLHSAFATDGVEDEDEDEFEMSLTEMYCEVFSQASRTIRDFALPTNIKRLRICHTSPVFYRTQTTRTTEEIGQLLKSVGPLEELLLHQCDMEAYLASFHDFGKPVEFPPIKELTISHPFRSFGMDFEEAMMGLVKSQHALGIPFERVTIRMDRLPAEMAEKLRPWVGAVHCYNEVEPTYVPMYTPM